MKLLIPLLLIGCVEDLRSDCDSPADCPSGQCLAGLCVEPRVELDRGPEPDAEADLEVEPPIDAAPDQALDAAPPDAAPDQALDAAPPPEICNGEDDDLDGTADEGTCLCLSVDAPVRRAEVSPSTAPRSGLLPAGLAVVWTHGPELWVRVGELSVMISSDGPFDAPEVLVIDNRLTIVARAGELLWVFSLQSGESDIAPQTIGGTGLSHATLAPIQVDGRDHVAIIYTEQDGERRLLRGNLYDPETNELGLPSVLAEGEYTPLRPAAARVDAELIAVATPKGTAVELGLLTVLGGGGGLALGNLQAEFTLDTGEALEQLTLAGLGETILLGLVTTSLEARFPAFSRANARITPLEAETYSLPLLPNTPRIYLSALPGRFGLFFLRAQANDRFDLFHKTVTAAGLVDPRQPAAVASIDSPDLSVDGHLLSWGGAVEEGVYTWSLACD